MKSRQVVENKREKEIAAHTTICDDLVSLISQYEALTEEEEAVQRQKLDYIRNSQDSLNRQANRGKFLDGFCTTYVSACCLIGNIIGGLVAAPFYLLGCMLNLVIYSGRDSWPDDPFVGTVFVFNVVKLLSSVFIGSTLGLVPAVIGGIINSLTRKVIHESDDKIAAGLWELSQKSSADFKTIIEQIIADYNLYKTWGQSKESQSLILKLEDKRTDNRSKKEAIVNYMESSYDNTGRRLFNTIANQLIPIAGEYQARPTPTLK